MTNDQVNSGTQSQNLNVNSVGNNNVSAPVTNASAVQTAPAQKVYTEEEVNNIIGAKKQKAYEKGYETAKSEFVQPAPTQPVQTQQYYAPPQQQYSQPQWQQPQPHVVPPVMPHAPTAPAPAGLTAEEARKIYAEEAQKNLQTQQYQALANNFVSKVEANKSKYADFDTVVGALDLPKIPEIWTIAAEFDDPAAIMYELGKSENLGKLASLRNLSYSPALVKRAMGEIHDSVKRNEEAEKLKANVAKPPLSRPRAPTVGMDSGKKDVTSLRSSDYKAQTRV